MKTGTITEVNGVREWTGDRGTLYFHKIVFDNGDFGDLAKKVSGAVKPGDTIAYTLEADNRGGNRIKEVRPSFQSGVRRPNGGGQGSMASFALSYSKDLVIANLAKTDKPIDMAQLADRVLATAERFNQWLKENA